MPEGATGRGAALRTQRVQSAPDAPKCAGSATNPATSPDGRACPNGGLAVAALSALNAAYTGLVAVERVVDIVADECAQPYVRPGNAAALTLARWLAQQEAALGVVVQQVAEARQALAEVPRA